MKKSTNKRKKEDKPNKSRAYLILATASITVVLLIWIVYPFFSNWKNSLYIPELPNFSGKPQVFVEYISRVHNAALAHPESDLTVGRLGMTFHSNFYYERAERCYIRAMTLDPGQWRWPYYFALINEELGDTHKTIINLKKVTEINPNIVQAWYRLGNAYLKQNAFQDALDAFNKVFTKQSFRFHPSSNIKLSNIGDFPLKAYASFNLGRTEFRQGKPDEACQTLLTLIKSYPTFGSAYRLLSQIYSGLGEPDKASYYLLRAGDFESYLPPADIIYDDLIFYSRKTDFIIKQIDIAIRSENYDWAVALNRHIIEYKPENKDVVTKLLKLSVDLHQKEGVKTYGELFSEMFKYDENKLLEMTRFLISRKQYKLAEFIIKQVHAINPGSLGAHIEYVSILRILNQFQKAVDYCKNIIVKIPDNPHIKIELARILIHQQKYNEAAEQLSLAEKIDPYNQAILLLWGRLWRAQKNATKSIEFFRKYLQTNPTDVVANLELGNYYIQLRSWKIALQHFEETIKTTPNHIDYLERYAWIKAACPNPRFRNGQKAMEIAERISIMRKFTEGQELRSAMTVAVTFAELKDFENALKIVNDSLIKLQTKDLKDFYSKFEALQKLFQAKKPYRL